MEPKAAALRLSFKKTASRLISYHCHGYKWKNINMLHNFRIFLIYSNDNFLAYFYMNYLKLRTNFSFNFWPSTDITTVSENYINYWHLCLNISVRVKCTQLFDNIKQKLEEGTGMNER